MSRSLNITPVILCGGSGTRLWPMSRKLLPKQFLPLVTSNSLLQDTALRASSLAGASGPIVVCNEDHRFLVAEQLSSAGVQPRLLMLEPVGRNTAAAVAAAAVAAEDDDPILLVLASDTALQGSEAFADAVQRAAQLADMGLLVTFGVHPTRPETGFGYIDCGAAIAEVRDAFRVAAFVEKPPADRAQALIDTGRAYWNSGMFVFRASRLIEELRAFRPDILEAARKAVEGAARDLDFFRLARAPFEACPSAPIDKAVMEKTASAAVIPAGFGWSDVGSWDAIWEITPKDAGGNAVRGDARLQETRNTLVFSERRLVTTLGVSDLVIVETDDAVLVARRGRSQDVRDIVESLQDSQRSEHLSHTRVYRPWGYYESLDVGEGFLVKRIMVKPGAALSLQMHHHRAEHWIVVSGAAHVVRGEESFELSSNQSTYIPLGVKHRLENRGSAPLHLIEVQSGRELREDDIVRFEDRYARQ